MFFCSLFSLHNIIFNNHLLPHTSLLLLLYFTILTTLILMSSHSPPSHSVSPLCDFSRALYWTSAEMSFFSVYISVSFSQQSQADQQAIELRGWVWREVGCGSEVSLSDGVFLNCCTSLFGTMMALFSASILSSLERSK